MVSSGRVHVPKATVGEPPTFNGPISGAETAADHKALAESYDAEAKEARAEAANHRAMKEAYGKGPTYAKVKRTSVMKQHCTRLIKSYENVAKQAEDLAGAHREMAGE